MQTQNVTDFLQSYRCPGCSKLLFKGVLVVSTIQVKCKKCGTLATFSCLDDIADEEQFSLLTDCDGTVVSMGIYKKNFCGPQQNLVGTKLSSLLMLMGYSEPYKEIEASVANHDSGKDYTWTDDSSQDAPFQLRWNFIERAGKTYIYIVFDRRAQVATELPVGEFDNRLLPMVASGVSLV